MKRFLKITALFLAVAMMAVTLCSCQHLEELRAHQMFYTDDTKREIEYDGQLYEMINTGKRTFVFTDLWGTDSSYSVTKRDVPVLLSQSEGDWVQMNNDRTLIMEWGSSYHHWYVRKDLYDNAKEKLQNSELEHYYFGYVIYPENYEDPDALAYQKNVLLDDDPTDIIHRVLKTPSDKRVSYKELSNDYYSSKRILLYACDEDMLVQEDDNIHLIKDSGNYYVWDGNTYEEKSFYPITDEKDKEVLSELFKNYPDAVDSENYHFYYEDDGYKYEYVDDRKYDVTPEAVREEYPEFYL